MTEQNPAAPDKAPLPEPVAADRDVTGRKFHRARTEAAFTENQAPDTAQTRDSAYRLAFRDTDFLLREELRPVRFQLELPLAEWGGGVMSLALADGPTEVHKVQVAKALLKRGGAAPGLFPSEHIPTRMEALS